MLDMPSHGTFQSINLSNQAEEGSDHVKPGGKIKNAQLNINSTV